MIVTSQAVLQLDQILQENPSQLLRIEIRAGGCSGFEQVFSFDHQQLDDQLIANRVLVDPVSFELIENAVLDYRQGIGEAKYRLTIPEAVSSCGCGRSFQI